MLPCRRFWEDIHPAKQRTTSMRSVLHSGNVGRRMTAMRNRNSLESDDFHNLNRGSRKFYHTTSVGISEVPALGVRDQEISENLNTCDRLEFFRINKISVERERVGFAEQLNQAAVFLDQIVR